MSGNEPSGDCTVNVEQFVVPGVVSVMLVFMIALGGAAFFSRDRK